MADYPIAGGLGAKHSLKPTGFTFTRTDAATITLTPDGVDGKAYIPVSGGSDLITVVLSSALTCALTTAGAGGLDTGSETAAKGYLVFLITKAAGVDPVLVFVRSDLSTNSGDPTYPTGYTHKSKPIFFVCNNGGASNNDILTFEHVGGKCFFTDIYTEMRILTSGQATSVAAVDCTDFAPNDSIALIDIYVTNETNSYNSIWLHYLQSTNNMHYRGSVDSTTVTTGWCQWGEFFEIPMKSTSTSLYYKWKVTPSVGVYVNARGFIL